MRRSYTGINLSPESAQLLALAREFSEERLRPTAGARDLHEDVFDGAIHQQLGELGFLGMRIPEAYGGLGLDLLTYLYVLEELAWGQVIFSWKTPESLLKLNAQGEMTLHTNPNIVVDF